MKLNIRQFLTNNLLYLITLIFSRGTSFLLLPIYTHVLVPSEYGIFAILFASMSFVSFAYTLGIENGLIRYLSEVKDKIEIQSTVFWAMLVFSFIFTLFIILFRQSISLLLFDTTQYQMLVALSAASLFMETFSKYYQYTVIGLQKPNAFLCIGFLKGICTIILSYIFLIILHKGLYGIFYAYIISHMIAAIIIIALKRKTIHLSIHWHWLKRISLLGFPMMLSSLFITGLNFADRFFIYHFKGSSEAGQYSVAYKLGMIMSMVVTVFSMSSIPFINILKKEKNSTQIFSYLFNRTWPVLFLVFLGCSLFLKPILSFSINGFQLIHSNFLQSLHIFPYILLSYVFYGCYINFSLPYYDHEKPHYLTFIVGLVFILNIVLNWMLIPKYGSTGAAVATLITFITMAVFSYIKMQQLWKIRYQLKNAIFMFFIVLFIFLVHKANLFTNRFLPVLLFLMYIMINFILMKYKIKKEKDF